MENVNNLESKKEYGLPLICKIQKPQCIMFLPDNTIAIGGIGKLAFFNPNTNILLNSDELNFAPDHIVQDIAANEDRTFLAIANIRNVTKYDTTTKKIVDTITPPHPKKFITFSSTELIIYHTGRSQSFILKETDNRISKDLNSVRPINGIDRPISYCPNRDAIIYQADKNKYSFYNLNQINETPRRYSNDKNIIGIICHPKKPFLALSHNNGCIVIDSDENKFSELYYNNSFPLKDSPHSVPFPSMTFNTDQILALLSWENTIQYWNYKTEKLVAVTPLDPSEKLDPQIKLTKRLSFSVDETYIAVALKNKCFILPLPFEALPPAKQESHLRFVLFALNNYTITELPKDILYLILKNILA
jgi:WD40 repeat protein